MRLLSCGAPRALERCGANWKDTKGEVNTRPAIRTLQKYSCNVRIAGLVFTSPFVSFQFAPHLSKARGAPHESSRIRPPSVSTSRNQNSASHPRLEVRGAGASRRISESVRTRDSLCLGLIAAYWNCSGSSFEDARGDYRRTINGMAVLGPRRTRQSH